jgi:hypothetical protein
MQANTAVSSGAAETVDEGALINAQRRAYHALKATIAPERVALIEDMSQAFLSTSENEIAARILYTHLTAGTLPMYPDRRQASLPLEAHQNSILDPDGSRHRV